MGEEEIRALVRNLFYAEHWKVGTISKQLDLHHETVKRLLGLRPPPSGKAKETSAVDPYVPFIRQTLEQYPTLTGARLTEMLRLRGFKGSERMVRRRIAKLSLRPRRVKEAFFRRTVLPGEEGQVDWAHFGKMAVPGGTRALSCFVMCLSWSRAVYAEFFLDQKLDSFLAGFVHAVESFGGTPRAVLVDNLKSVVLERRGDAIRYHPRSLELCGHYLTMFRPCAPGRGNEKGRVERRILDLRKSFWPARRYRDLEDLNRQLADWIRQIAHPRRRPSDSEGRAVEDALMHERSHLLPLPVHAFDTSRALSVTPRKHPYLRFDRNLYSIPHEIVGETLTVLATSDRLRVLLGAKQVAEHQRSWGLSQIIEDPDHLAGLARTKRKAHQSRTRDHLAAAVPTAKELFELLARRGEHIGATTQKLYRLLDRYGADDLEQAIGEVLRSGNPSVGSVAYLLDRRRRLEGTDPTRPISIPGRPDLTNLRVDFPKLGDYDEL